MSDKKPLSACAQLRNRIQEEEDRTRQNAKKVRISVAVAQDLMVMEAEDWLKEAKGFTDWEFCKKLASAFLREGEKAANGLSLSIVGPILEVAEDYDAPDVEITLGNPWPT